MGLHTLLSHQDAHQTSTIRRSTSGRSASITWRSHYILHRHVIPSPRSIAPIIYTLMGPNHSPNHYWTNPLHLKPFFIHHQHKVLKNHHHQQETSWKIITADHTITTSIIPSLRKAATIIIEAGITIATAPSSDQTMLHHSSIIIHVCLRYFAICWRHLWSHATFTSRAATRSPPVIILSIASEETFPSAGGQRWITTIRRGRSQLRPEIPSTFSLAPSKPSCTRL